MKLSFALVALTVLTGACTGCGQKDVAVENRTTTAARTNIFRNVGPSGHIDEDGDHDFYRGGGDYWQAALSQDENAVLAATSGHPVSAELTTDATARTDADHDDDNHKAVLAFGHSASIGEQHAIASSIRRYLRAGAAHDATAGCALLASTIAGALRRSDNGRLRRHGCHEALAKLFALRHVELTKAARTLQLVTVRTNGERAIAFLSFARSPNGRQLALRRERGNWRLAALLDGELPFDGEAG